MRRHFANFLSGLLLSILFINQVIAQNAVKVNGKVTDNVGIGLPAVSIIVKGTTKGTYTDVEGNYSIEVKEGNTLVFSFLGFQTREVTVKQQTLINIQLAESKTMLSQVVVVGYGSQRKLDVTGAVATVKGEEIAKQSTGNAVSALQGKVAGVSITNAGSPGASPQIRIRGLGTVYGNANPLYVVDGAWFDDISFLNPADVESVNILKDASSEAMYGVRAANGVVLITTRKGKGKPQINYAGYAGVQTISNTVKMANGPEYATLVNELNGAQTFSNPSSFGQGTDWLNAVTRNAFTTNQYISVGGSTEKSSYNYSLGYFGQNGNIEKNKYSRITARLQNDIQAVPFIKVGYNAILESSKSTDIPSNIIYKAITAAPIVPVRYADGSYGDPSDYPVGNIPNNPLLQLNVYDQQSKNYRVTGNAFINVDLLKGLAFKSSFGGEFGEGDVRSYNPVYNYNVETMSSTHSQYNQISVLNVSQSKVRNWLWENTLNYDKTIDRHRFSLLGGFSAQRYQSYYMNGAAQNVPNGTSGDFYLTLGNNDTRQVSDGGSISTYESFFGRVNYAFSDKYLLNASLRADGSSKFTGDQRWGYFPSIGAGWVISKENFMKDLSFIDELKLRGSWGKVGNASVPANLSILRVDNRGEFTAVYNGIPFTGASITSIVPPLTYWERGVGSDVALEAGFFKNRLTTEIDWYNRDTEQAIFAIPILSSLGTSSSEIIGNQANIRNRGIEFSLGWQDRTSSVFNYSINGNFSINNNKVLSVLSGENPIYAGGDAATGGQLSTRTIVGQPIGQFYGLVVDGIFQNAQEIAASVQPDAKPGDFKYRDTNGDGIIDAADRQVLGNPNPKYLFGLNTNLTYKSIDFTLDLQGVAGVDIYNANKGVRYGAENYTKDFYDKRWRGEGTSNFYPSANIGGGNNYKPNSWYVEDGSYLRIRNVQLGYTLPKSLTSDWKMERVRVYCNAQNPLTFFKYTGFSPEVGGSPTNAGIDRGIYPLYSTYNFGLNVTF